MRRLRGSEVGKASSVDWLGCAHRAPKSTRLHNLATTLTSEQNSVCCGQLALKFDQGWLVIAGDNGGSLHSRAAVQNDFTSTLMGSLRCLHRTTPSTCTCGIYTTSSVHINISNGLLTDLICNSQGVDSSISPSSNTFYRSSGRSISQLPHTLFPVNRPQTMQELHVSITFLYGDFQYKQPLSSLISSFLITHSSAQTALPSVHWLVHSSSYPSIH